MSITDLLDLVPVAQARSAQSDEEHTIINIDATDATFECPEVGSFSIPTTCAYYYSCTEVEGNIEVSNFKVKNK